jgi:hypothetical protein
MIFNHRESFSTCFLIKPSAERGGNIFQQQQPGKWSERKNSLSFHQQLQFIRIYFRIAFFTQPENLGLFCWVKKLFQFLIGAAHSLLIDRKYSIH